MRFNANKILIINIGGLGDILFSVPFLKGLRKKFPLARIDLLTVSNSYEIIKNLDFIDNVFILNSQTNDLRHPGINNLPVFKQLLTLRKERYSLAINLRTIVTFASALKMLFILFVIRPDKTAGRDSEGLGFFYDIKIEEKVRYMKHEVYYHSELAKKLGFKAEGRPEIKLEKSNIKYALKFYKENKITERKKFIIINFESRWQSKKLPDKLVFDLIKILNGLKYYRVGIILYGSTEIEGKLKELYKNIVIIKNEEIKNIAAVLSFADLLITNDTGIMHVAAALNVPIVGVFGSSDPYLTGPVLSENRKRIIWKHVKCAPCNITDCKKLDCFNMIKAGEIVSKAKEIIKK